MIGSHDTFTYMQANSWLHNICSRWWKTQCRTLKVQYAKGIRFFDIRVYRDHGAWTLCHGVVNFTKTFPNIEDFCIMMLEYPEAIYRIVLEKGDSYDEDIFCTQAKSLCKKYPNLWRVDIKASGKWMGAVCNNNDSLYKTGYKFAKVNVWQSPAHELHGFLNSRNWYKTNLKKEAKKINSSLDFFKDKTKLKQMIESKDELYFLDYCTNEY